MPLYFALMAISAAALVGAILGWFLRMLVTLGRRGSVELEIKEMMLAAREAAERVSAEGEREAADFAREARAEAKKAAERLAEREDRIAQREASNDRQREDLDERGAELERREAEAKAARDEAERLAGEHRSALERVGGLSAEDARRALQADLERAHGEDAIVRLRKLEHAARETLDAKARDILATAIQRLATQVGAETFTTPVAIPSDEVKGRIIGKEGRNIKAFERATGVEVLVDDTPGTITLSSFDPIRRATADLALRELLDDGRIQPARIEEAVAKAREKIDDEVKRRGEEAAFECGAFELDPRIVAILGRLHFRTSHGQNVLRHSVEMSHLAGMLAEELGADVRVAKTAALLHDIGKAVDHELPGTHVEIGRRILQKFGADEAVIQAMQAHHGEYPYESAEAILVQVADQLSGGRPGARRESLDGYVKRLGDLEAIAQEFPGVEKAFAVSAGRELRIFVKPDEVSDLKAYELARSIAQEIEKRLRYPGEIKVAVMRESRAIEYAR
jgi:ribonuclease Y